MFIALLEITHTLELPDVAAPQELRQHGFGYRAKFIHQTARLLVDRHGTGLAADQWLLSLRNVPYADAHAALLELPGVCAVAVLVHRSPSAASETLLMLAGLAGRGPLESRLALVHKLYTCAYANIFGAQGCVMHLPELDLHGLL